jgi:uncharacterized integral membrane protein
MPAPVGSADTDPAEPEATSNAVTAPPIPSTRAGRTWLRVLPALLLLTVTGVFVVQNLRSAKVSFFTVSGHLPLGVALLAAAALGALVVLALGSVRILQLRSLVRRTTTAAQRSNVTDGSAPS